MVNGNDENSTLLLFENKVEEVVKENAETTTTTPPLPLLQGHPYWLLSFQSTHNIIATYRTINSRIKRNEDIILFRCMINFLKVIPIFFVWKVGKHTWYHFIKKSFLNWLCLALARSRALRPIIFFCCYKNLNTIEQQLQLSEKELIEDNKRKRQNKYILEYCTKKRTRHWLI